MCEMASEGELSTNKCKLLEQIYRHSSTHPQKPAHRLRERRSLYERWHYLSVCVIIKLEKHFALLPFLWLYWRLKMCVCVCVYEGFHTFFTQHESLYGNHMNTHAAHTLRGMRSHHAAFPFNWKWSSIIWMWQQRVEVCTSFKGLAEKRRCVFKLAE